MSEPLALEHGTICSGCGAELGPSLLVCPACRRLVHADELKRLAERAQREQAAGELAAARRTWREALERLPTGTRQSGVIAERIAELNRRLEGTPQAAEPEQRTPRPAWVKALGPVGILLFFVLTKGKLLFLGLTKAGTLLSMLAAFGVYWTAWGWPFALGLVVSIYIHEMGHVAALRHYGLAATAPMFLPGVGALVRLKQRPADPVEDARIGLAGPVWGLGAAIASAAIYAATGAGIWAAIARTGAWINLFNLLPLGPLDGGRTFSALSASQRLAAAFVMAGAWAVTRDGLLALLAVVAVARAFMSRAPERGHDRTAWELCVVVAALTALVLIRVPVQP